MLREVRLLRSWPPQETEMDPMCWISWHPCPNSTIDLDSRRSATSDGPPVILLIACLADYTACGPDVLFQLPFPVEMVVAVESLIFWRNFLAFDFFLSSHDPRHHHVLGIRRTPSPATAFLLQSPDIDESLTAGIESLKDGFYGLDSPFRCGQMMDDSDRYCEIKPGRLMRKIEDIRDYYCVWLVLGGDGD